MIKLLRCSKRQRGLFFAAALAQSVIVAAHADPCEAPLPSKAGTVFNGTVTYIVDGDGLCVGIPGEPETWIEVRTVDFDAPELNTETGRVAKARMKAVAEGKQAACVVMPGRRGRTTSWDRVHAACEIEGESLAGLMGAD